MTTVWKMAERAAIGAPMTGEETKAIGLELRRILRVLRAHVVIPAVRRLLDKHDIPEKD